MLVRLLSAIATSLLAGVLLVGLSGTAQAADWYGTSGFGELRCKDGTEYAMKPGDTRQTTYGGLLVLSQVREGEGYRYRLGTTMSPREAQTGIILVPTGSVGRNGPSPQRAVSLPVQPGKSVDFITRPKAPLKVVRVCLRTVPVGQD
ncbi:hypothetical protein JNJ66_06605 [Candidatus Saccharibacteria bacterium]|nr:hypothetical protein [Candidatus Saccharibacteria bacterium]